jgi:hypothetical protein
MLQSWNSNNKKDRKFKPQSHQKTERIYEWGNRIMETGEVVPISHTLAMYLCVLGQTLTLTIHLHYPDKNPDRDHTQGFTYLLVDH